VSRLIVLLSALAIIVPILPALAVSESQDGSTKIKSGGDQPSEVPLREVEREIAANRFQESEPRLKAYLKEHPDSSRAHYDLGYIQFRTHNVAASIKELSKSLELNAANAEAHKILGLDCSIIGRDDLAETELVEAARLKPESGEIHYFLARTYYTRGVYPLAKSEFQTAIRLEPSFVKAYSNLGITMEALGDSAEALKNYTKAIQLEDRPLSGLEIRFNPEEDYVTVDDFRHTTNDPWTFWSHAWTPTKPGIYFIRLRLLDSGIRSRRLDAGYYTRSVEVTEV
jgi:Flp pilus assembly protein TadD